MAERRDSSNSNWLDAISRNFERLLRWAYPSALLFTLLLLSLPASFFNGPLSLASEFHSLLPWILLVGFLTVGFAVYLFQSQVINVFTSFLSVILRWEKNAKYKDTLVPRGCLRIFVNTFDAWASVIEEKWPDVDKRIDYMNYAWSVYHAASITGWLTLLFFLFIKQEHSIFAYVDTLEVWIFTGSHIICFFSVSLIIFSLVTYGYLSRVSFAKQNNNADESVRCKLLG